MTPLIHLGIIEELARNSASYSEFRLHLIAIQEALESFAALQQEHTVFKDSATKEKSEADKKFMDLNLRYLEAKSDVKNYEAQRNAKSGGDSEISPGLKR